MNKDDKKPRQYWLYTLLCENEKYYVGVTTKTPEERLREHQLGITAANWTRDHKPIKIVEQINLGIRTYERAERFENKITRQYMHKYGVNNVRGGDLTNLDQYEERVFKFGYLMAKDKWKDFTQITLTIFFLVLLISILAYLYRIK